MKKNFGVFIPSMIKIMETVHYEGHRVGMQSQFSGILFVQGGIPEDEKGLEGITTLA
jgi:hypothetical protein